MHELQKAFQNVTTQVNGTFKSPAFVKAPSILPSLVSSLPKTVGWNPNLTALP
jgi:hypothetical protein